jgi:hypothetical protein
MEDKGSSHKQIVTLLGWIVTREVGPLDMVLRGLDCAATRWLSIYVSSLPYLSPCDGIQVKVIWYEAVHQSELLAWPWTDVGLVYSTLLQ